MEPKLTLKERQQIEESIKGKYVKVAAAPDGLFRYPTGLAGLRLLKYDPDILQAIPEPIKDFYCGVGNPFTLGPIHKGEAVLDIGCGAGVDTIVAAMMVGPEGSATGIEMVPQMAARARENLHITDFENVTFEDGSAEKLPFPKDCFDVVISNGVFNLLIDKARALKEAFRVLKSRGRLMVADQILVGELPKGSKERVKKWAG